MQEFAIITIRLWLGAGNLFLKPDTLITVTDACPAYAGCNSRIDSIAVDEHSFEPLFMVSLFCPEAGAFRVLPFFKGQLMRRRSTAREFERFFIAACQIGQAA